MTSPDQNGQHRASGTDKHDRPSDPEVAALQDDIELVREDLAATVDQLAQRLDVKSRVRDQVSEKKEAAVTQLHDLQDRATDDSGRPTPAAVAVAGAAAAGLVLLLVLRWRRKDRA